MDTDLIITVTIFLSVVVIAGFLIFHTIKKRKEFYEKLRRLALERGFTFSEKPVRNRNYSLSGSQNGVSWEFYEYYSSTKDGTTSSTTYNVFEANGLSGTATIIMSMKVNFNLAQLDMNNRLVRTALKLILGEDYSDDLTGLSEVPYGTSRIVREGITVLSNSNGDLSHYFDGETEQFLISEIERNKFYGSNLMILPGKMKFRFALLKDERTIDNIIRNCLNILSKLR